MFLQGRGPLKCVVLVSSKTHPNIGVLLGQMDGPGTRYTRAIYCSTKTTKKEPMHPKKGDPILRKQKGRHGSRGLRIFLTAASFFFFSSKTSVRNAQTSFFPSKGPSSARVFVFFPPHPPHVFRLVGGSAAPAPKGPAWRRLFQCSTRAAWGSTGRSTGKTWPWAKIQAGTFSEHLIQSDH